MGVQPLLPMIVPLSDDRAFSAIFDRAVEAILLADDDGRYVRVNPAAEKLTGYSDRELRSMTVMDLTPTADKEQGVSSWRELIRLGALSGDYILTRRDGSSVEVDFHAVANIMPGVHLSILRVATAREREEGRLRRAARLQQVTAAMSAAVDMTQVADVILAGGLSTLEAHSGHLIAAFDHGRWGELVATAGMEEDREEKWAATMRMLGAPPKTVDGRYRFPLDENTLLGETFRRGESMRVMHAGDVGPSRALRLFEDLGPTMVCLPLVASGELVGGLYLFWRVHRSLGEHEHASAVTLAGLCAQALARARLFTAEREARERAVASEKTVLEYQEQLKRMAFDHVLRGESERRRIATALHDGVTQYLALSKMKLDPFRQRLDGAERTALDVAMRLIDDAIEETRSLTFELSPPILYDLGIRAALSWLAEKLEESAGLRVEITDDGIEPSIDEVTASIVFRAVRELLMNVIKHAVCASATVTLRNPGDALEIVVEDTGSGFDPAEVMHVGFGLMSVREEIGRLGGTVTIESARGEGTRASVRAPSAPD